jgi:hypothetical protein
MKHTAEGPDLTKTSSFTFILRHVDFLELVRSANHWKNTIQSPIKSAETPKPVKNDRSYIRVAARGTVRPAGKQQLRVRTS